MSINPRTDALKHLDEHLDSLIPQDRLEQLAKAFVLRAIPTIIGSHGLSPALYVLGLPEDTEFAHPDRIKLDLLKSRGLSIAFPLTGPDDLHAACFEFGVRLGVEGFAALCCFFVSEVSVTSEEGTTLAGITIVGSSIVGGQILFLRLVERDEMGRIIGLDRPPAEETISYDAAHLAALWRGYEAALAAGLAATSFDEEALARLWAQAQEASLRVDGVPPQGCTPLELEEGNDGPS